MGKPTATSLFVLLQQQRITTMSLAASRIVATRAMARRVTVQQEQKRGIVDYLTNYPDKVSTESSTRRWS
jgi:ribosomal protein L16/L10AE